MINFAGVIGRKEYVHKTLFLFLELVIVSLLLFALMDAQDAELQGSPALSQGLAILAFILLIFNGLFVTVVSFSLTIRRARDAGATVMWTVLSYLVPFAFIVLGFIPSSNSKRP